MVVWVSHARVGHRQGFIPEAPSQTLGASSFAGHPRVRRRHQAPGLHRPPVTPVRGGAVWQLVGLITRRSQVQILPPLPMHNANGDPWVAVLRWGIGDWGFVIRKAPAGPRRSQGEQGRMRGPGGRGGPVIRLRHLRLRQGARPTAAARRSSICLQDRHWTVPRCTGRDPGRRSRPWRCRRWPGRPRPWPGLRFGSGDSWRARLRPGFPGGCLARISEA